MFDDNNVHTGADCEKGIEKAGRFGRLNVSVPLCTAACCISPFAASGGVLCARCDTLSGVSRIFSLFLANTTVISTDTHHDEFSGRRSYANTEETL